MKENMGFCWHSVEMVLLKAGLYVGHITSQLNATLLYLLVGDVGQDASDDLEQENTQQQTQILQDRARTNRLHWIKTCRKSVVQPRHKGQIWEKTEIKTLLQGSSGFRVTSC